MWQHVVCFITFSTPLIMITLLNTDIDFNFHEGDTFKAAIQCIANLFNLEPPQDPPHNQKHIKIKSCFITRQVRSNITRIAGGPPNEMNGRDLI
jgi:hypothetical protein